MLGVDTKIIQKLRIVIYQRIMLTHLHLHFNYLTIIRYLFDLVTLSNNINDICNDLY